MKLLPNQLQFKDNNLWWIVNLYPFRNDGKLIDYWNGKYPSFIITRRKQIRFFIKLYKTSLKNKI